MKCEKCGFENSLEDKFCTKCGNELNTSELQQLPSDNNVEELVIEEKPVEEKQEEVQEEKKEEIPEEVNVKVPKKKINLVQYVAIILVVSLVVGSIVYFSMSVSLKKYKEVSIKNSPYNEVKLDGFTYKIPQEYSYEKDKDYISITNKDESWIIQLGSTKSSYDTLKSNKAILQEAFLKDGIKASIPKVENINDKEYLTLELDENSKKSLVAYSKFNSMYINVVLVRNINNDYDYDKLEIANSIINNSTFNDEELKIENENYNLDDLIKTTDKAK